MTPRGEGITPEQAIVRFGSADSGEAHFAAAAVGEGDDIEVSVTFAAIVEQLTAAADTVELSIIAGNTRPEVAVELAVGEVALQGAGSDTTQAASTKSGMAALQQPKAPIAHTHRSPEKRTPAVVALAFTGAALAPFALLALLGMQTWVAYKVRHIVMLFLLCFTLIPCRSPLVLASHSLCLHLPAGALRLWAALCLTMRIPRRHRRHSGPAAALLVAAQPDADHRPPGCAGAGHSAGGEQGGSGGGGPSQV